MPFSVVGFIGGVITGFSVVALLVGRKGFRRMIRHHKTRRWYE